MADEFEQPLPSYVTTPLLTRITEQSMDEDYQQVALRKSDGEPREPEAARPRLIVARKRRLSR